MKHTPQSIAAKKEHGEKITALSLYDHPSARIADEAGVDILVIGDSVAMALLGQSNTREVKVEDILYHTRAVARAARRALVVADMPIHSFEDPEKALENAKRFVAVGADAVKLEGGSQIQPQVQHLIAAGIPVMGHLGLLPQNAGERFQVRGRTEEEAKAIAGDAKMLARLGIFSLVLECVPAALAREITRTVQCPTIGIGAGPGTDGQVLVLQDILGVRSSVSPRFVRRYANLETIMKKAIEDYCRDVTRGDYPSPKESFE
ncbi:MAG: 3-methyl-2-oxobutanoate hydroxymethyltransferase [Candidatus Omnitrophica bacterium]|nr:3-methyl-2-oxobutanoate hydroxymethyltransferase [Candidatus Omnitrophota bacterium]